MGGVLCKSGSGVRCGHHSLHIDAENEYAAVLRSYEASCEDDPDLKSCDVAIHGRVNKIVQALAKGARTQSQPVEAFMEVADGLRETDQDVVKFILEFRDEVFGDEELFNLVQEYLTNSLQTLKFCSALEHCLKRACNSQQTIKLAVQIFEQEMSKGADANYEKALQQLRRFKQAGDPFTGDFFNLFHSVYKRQRSMFSKLTKQKNKLDRKLKSMKTWKKVSNVIFIAAFSSVLILSVVGAAVAAPPVVIALAAALTAPVASIGKWCDTLWKPCIKEKEEKSERVELMAKASRLSQPIVSMEKASRFLLSDLEFIGRLVCHLEGVIEQLLRNPELGVGDEDGVKILLGELRRRLEVFEDGVEELSKRSAKCSMFVTCARDMILKKISTPNT